MKYPLKLFVVCIGKHCNNLEHVNERGEVIQEELKDHNKKLGRKSSVRVCKVSCLDLCDYGPNMVVYPNGTVYSGLDREKARAAYDGELGDGPPRPDLELTLPAGTSEAGREP